MTGIGHFPMVENPALFIDRYRLPVLDTFTTGVPRAAAPEET